MFSRGNCGSVGNQTYSRAFLSVHIIRSIAHTRVESVTIPLAGSETEQVLYDSRDSMSFTDL